VNDKERKNHCHPYRCPQLYLPLSHSKSILRQKNAIKLLIIESTRCANWAFSPDFNQKKKNKVCEQITTLNYKTSLIINIVFSPGFMVL
jgi:hypothetical protein